MSTEFTEDELIEHAFGDLTEDYREGLLTDLRRPQSERNVYSWADCLPANIRKIWNKLDMRCRIVAWMAAEDNDRRSGW